MVVAVAVVVLNTAVEHGCERTGGGDVVPSLDFMPKEDEP